MQKKIVFKSFFQIEYILIVLSLIFGFLLQTLKTKSLTSFNRLDQNLEIIQKHYVGTPATPATNEPINHLIVQEVQNDSIVFTLFDEKINRNLLKIITLCTDYDIYGSEQLIKLLFSAISEFESEIHIKERKLIFGYDFLLQCLTFLLFLSILTLASKYIMPKYLSENQTEAQNKDKKKELAVGTIIKISIFIIIAVLINFGGSFLARILSVPLYFDSVSTIAVTALFGLIPGIICATLSNSLLYLFDYTMIPFVLCHILTALLADLTFRKHKKKSSLPLTLSLFLWAGLWSGLSNGIFGNIIATYLYPSPIRVTNIDITTQAIYAGIQNLTISLNISGLITNITDKMISTLFSFMIYKIVLFNRKV